jgi:hypothetical protein
MNAIRLVAALGAAAMVVAIGVAALNGSILEEGSVIWGLPWGKVTLIDLYVGLVLFGAWISFRERSAGKIALWWVGLAALGNLAAALYLLKAAVAARTPAELLTGSRH